MCFEIKNQEIGKVYESGIPIVYIKYNDEDLSIKVSKALIQNIYGINANIDSCAKEIVESQKHIICKKLINSEKDILLNVQK